MNNFVKMLRGWCFVLYFVSGKRGCGGAIYHNGTSLTLNNVTIAGNISINGAGGLPKSRLAPIICGTI